MLTKTTLCQDLKLTEKQLILLRASARGLKAGDDTLFEENVEKVAQITGLDYPSAERRLIANVNHELEQLNNNRQNHWLQKVTNGDATVLHDEISFD